MGPVSVSRKDFEMLLKMKEELEKEAAGKSEGVITQVTGPDPGKVTQRELWEYAKPKLDAAEKGIATAGKFWLVAFVADHLTALLWTSIIYGFGLALLVRELLHH